MLFKDRAGGLDCLRCGGVLRLHRLNVCITGQERECAVDQPLQVMIGQVVIDAGPIWAPRGCANCGAKGFAEAVIITASVASAALGIAHGRGSQWDMETLQPVAITQQRQSVLDVAANTAVGTRRPLTRGLSPQRGERDSSIAALAPACPARKWIMAAFDHGCGDVMRLRSVERREIDARRVLLQHRFDMQVVRRLRQPEEHMNF